MEEKSLLRDYRTCEYPGQDVFIVKVVNLVTTKVIKHRVNGWEPCE